MSEMRNYSKPPQAVHDVLSAALLLLGDSEDSTKVRGILVNTLENLPSDQGNPRLVITRHGSCGHLCIKAIRKLSYSGNELLWQCRDGVQLFRNKYPQQW